MTLHQLQRSKIMAALIEFRQNYDGSQTDFCKTFGINPAAYSQIKAAVRDEKPLDKIIADDKLVTIGRKLNVNFRNETPWKLARIETFEYITPQLEHCQDKRIGRIFCDIADIGKTTTAKHYMLTHQNVFYLDCGQCKDKAEFTRALAKVVGVNNQGSPKDVYRDTIFQIQAMDKPLVILDEFGDLNDSAFLNFKSYWNALEDACGWYVMGADGLKSKMERGIRRQRLGYVEIFRRLGGEFMSVTKDKNPAELAAFKRRQVMDVAQHNMPEGMQLQDVTKNTLSLTRVKENIRKSSGTTHDDKNKGA